MKNAIESSSRSIPNRLSNRDSQDAHLITQRNRNRSTTAVLRSIIPIVACALILASCVSSELDDSIECDTGTDLAIERLDSSVGVSTSGEANLDGNKEEVTRLRTTSPQSAVSLPLSDRVQAPPMKGRDSVDLSHDSNEDLALNRHTKIDMCERSADRPFVRPAYRR